MFRGLRSRPCLEALEERWTPTTVTSLADDGTGGTLRAAIATATKAGGDGIVDFAPGLTGTITLGGTQLTINAGLVIQGPGAKAITISGNSASRIFEITNGAGSVINVSISGLGLTNGLGTGGTAGNNAGAISLPGNETVTLDGLFIRDSVTAGNGGAIRIVSGNVTILNSTIANNRSLAAGPATTNGGGAIKTAVGLGSLTLRNTTIYGNSANAAGGGLNIDGGPTTIDNCTITNNTANADDTNSEPGGGISLIGSGSARLLNSTIVAGNFRGTTSPTPEDISGTFTNTSANNLIGRGLSDSGLTNGVNGNQVGPTSGTTLGPLLGPLQDNGGPMPTMALLSGSPALNTGANPNGLGFDQRGTPFQRDFGGVDIGAYETQPFATMGTLVSSTSTSGLGQSVTFTATVTAPTAGVHVLTGTVNFFDGATLLGSAPLSNGVATFPTAALAGGTHTITAVFVANADFQTSTLNVVNQVVAAPRPALLAVGAGPGGGPHVEAFDAATGALRFSFLAYAASFMGGVRVAVGDVTGDGTPDIVTGAGPGAGPHVKVFDGNSGAEVRSFFAFDPSFTGGVYVGAGDVDGDGRADILVGAGAGAGPHVKAFSAVTGAEVRSFFAYGPAFSGGVTVAGGDVNGDTIADILTGTGPGAGPHVKVFSGATGEELWSFFAFEPADAAGAFVGAVDSNGDGRAEVLVGRGTGAPPQARSYSGATGALLLDFVAPTGDPFSGPAERMGMATAGSGVRVAGLAARGAQRSRLLTLGGPGARPLVTNFDLLDGGTRAALVDQFFAFDPAFTGGGFVAAG